MSDNILDALATAKLPSGDLVPDSTYIRRIYLQIDDQARILGRAEQLTHGTPAELRRDADRFKARGLLWLEDRARDLAHALDTDVRMAAMPMLYAHASLNMLGGVSPTFLNWYSVLLREHVKMLRDATRKAA